MLSTIARKALTAAIVAAAGAAGSYVFRQMMEKRGHGRNGSRARQQDKVDVSRWEGEGGSPPDLTAAVPHQKIGTQ